jgi:hypothetical protein
MTRRPLAGADPKPTPPALEGVLTRASGFARAQHAPTCRIARESVTKCALWRRRAASTQGMRSAIDD